MRTKVIVSSALLLLVSACASSPAEPEPGKAAVHDPKAPPQRPQNLAPNASAVIAAELAFARLARDKGQWTAFRETALPQSEMFVPKRVRALDWLKGRADPPVSVTWQPHAVYISCDGSAGATTGAAQWPGGGHGYFTTVWWRMRDGSYRWLLDHGAPVATPRVAPEFITARTASCDGKAGVELSVSVAGNDVQTGLSLDQTLQWRSDVAPDGQRTITILLWNGKTLDPVITDFVSAKDAQ